MEKEELEQLLKKSVKLCTQADVDYGVYYSKGVDSTLISTFHKFKNKFYFDDQINYEKDFKKIIKKIAYHLDFPVGSFSSYPLWKLAERAKKNNVKVILSGEGIINPDFLTKKIASIDEYIHLSEIIIGD